jgi:hypothetical protein
MLAERSNHGSRIFARHFYQHGETRTALDERGDVTVFRAADEIALPMTGDGPVLNLRGSFSNSTVIRLPVR